MVDITKSHLRPTPSQLEVINEYDTVFKSSRQSPTSLFVILFNVESPEEGSIEVRFKKWQKQYETCSKVRFFKCIINQYEQVMRNQFKIKDTPTLVFIRNGNEIDRIDDLDESNPDIVDSTDVNEENADEKRVKQKLDKLCKDNH